MSCSLTHCICRRVRSWSRRSRSCVQSCSRSWRRSESAGPTWRPRPKPRPGSSLKTTSQNRLWRATRTSTTSSPTWSGSPPSWSRHTICPPSMSSSRNSRQVSRLSLVTKLFHWDPNDSFIYETLSHVKGSCYSATTDYIGWFSTATAHTLTSACLPPCLTCCLLNCSAHFHIYSDICTLDIFLSIEGTANPATVYANLLYKRFMLFLVILILHVFKCFFNLLNLFVIYIFFF